jgi:hypothetical protein
MRKLFICSRLFPVAKRPRGPSRFEIDTGLLLRQHVPSPGREGAPRDPAARYQNKQEQNNAE